MRGKCHKGNKNAKEMVRKHEEMIIHKSLKAVGKNIKKLWETSQQDLETLSLRLASFCGSIFGTLNCLMFSQVIS